MSALLWLNNCPFVSLARGDDQLGNVKTFTFRHNCPSTAFGDNCPSAAFGDNCPSAAFGDNCPSAAFGDNCSDNGLGRSQIATKSAFPGDLQTLSVQLFKMEPGGLNGAQEELAQPLWEG